MEGSERDRLYVRTADEAPAFASYERQTTRVIPAFRLERVA